jgi:hypothetical protein
MTGVLLFIGGIILFGGWFVFFMREGIRIEHSFIDHLKANYPAIYVDNPYAVGGIWNGRLMLYWFLKPVTFTRRKTAEAKKEYKLAKQDAIVRRLKAKAWLLIFGQFFILPIWFFVFILFFGTLPN